MAQDELNLVLDTWMRSSSWKRREIVAAIENNRVLVARDDAGLALGWLCSDDVTLFYAYVKGAYRDVGLLRVLWDCAGQPRGSSRDNAVQRAMKRLVGER
jgi:hypothetical protein